MVSSKPRVYTLPACSRCDALKNILKKQGVEFEEVIFDTNVHVEFIMRNFFGNPPIFEAGSKIILSEDIFLGEVLAENKLWEAMKSEEG